MLIFYFYFFGSDGRLLEASLLSIKDKLNLVLTRTTSYGEKFLVSTHLFEWRQVLAMDRQVTSIELIGAGKCCKSLYNLPVNKYT